MLVQFYSHHSLLWGGGEVGEREIQQLEEVEETGFLSCWRAYLQLTACEGQGGPCWMQSTGVLLIETVEINSIKYRVYWLKWFVSRSTTLISSSFSFSSRSTLFFISASASRVFIPLQASFLALPASQPSLSVVWLVAPVNCGNPSPLLFSLDIMLVWRRREVASGGVSLLSSPELEWSR